MTRLPLIKFCTCLREAGCLTESTRPRPRPPRRRTRSIIRWWTTPAGSLPDRRHIIRIALTLAALSLAVVVASTSVWNYYGLSLPVPKPTGHLTASRPPVPGGSLDRPSGAIEWEFDARAPITASPTSAGGAIYVVSGATADTGSITSLTESAGSRLWQVRLRSIADYPPVAAGDMVYVGTRAGSLIALDRDTGETLWLADLESSVVGSPIVHDGAIYVASNAVYAIDAATGKQLWRHEVGGAVSRPVRLSNGIVAAIGSDGNVNLISAANGRRRLTFPLWFGTSAAPAVSGATLVIPGDRAFVQALDIDRRDVPMEKALRYWWTKLWLWDMAPRPPLPRAYLWQNRAIGDDTAYALGADDQRRLSRSLQDRRLRSRPRPRPVHRPDSVGSPNDVRRHIPRHPDRALPDRRAGCGVCRPGWDRANRALGHP